MLEPNFKQYKPYFELLDQLFEIERKLENIEESNSISRNLNKMKDIFETNLFSSSTSSEIGFAYLAMRSAKALTAASSSSSATSSETRPYRSAVAESIVSPSMRSLVALPRPTMRGKR